jgi:hypothetical protein
MWALFIIWHTSNMYLSCCHLWDNVSWISATAASDILPFNCSGDACLEECTLFFIWIPQNKSNEMRMGGRDIRFSVPIHLSEIWDSQSHRNVLLRHHVRKWCIYVLKAVEFAVSNYELLIMLFFLRRLTTVLLWNTLGRRYQVFCKFPDYYTMYTTTPALYCAWKDLNCKIKFLYSHFSCLISHVFITTGHAPVCKVRDSVFIFTGNKITI